MKILQIIPYFCFGGAEIMCENLVYAQKQLGHEVIAVSLGPERTVISQRMEAAGVRVEYLDKKPGLDLNMIPRLVKLMKREKPDAVHSHLSVIKYVGLAAKLAGAKKYVHTVHSVAYEEAEGPLQKITNQFYFRNGWAVPVALSPEIQKTVLDLYGLAPEQVPIIYNGVDLSRCIPKEDHRTGETVNILHVGRFDTPKNHPGLLRAFARLHRELPQCRLHLVGDGESRPEMEVLAKELGIGNAVTFHGMQSNVYPYLHDADIFVLPSIYEGIPMTIIEAMGTGLPVIASAVGGVPDMLRHGESGILVSCDPEEVSRACAGLARDEALRRRLGETARADSVRFSAEHMAKRYCEVYVQKGR